MCVWIEGARSMLPDATTALLEQGRHLSSKGGKGMLRINMNLNFTIHFPIQWIVALLYPLFK